MIRVTTNHKVETKGMAPVNELLYKRLERTSSKNCAWGWRQIEWKIIQIPKACQGGEFTW